MKQFIRGALALLMAALAVVVVAAGLTTTSARMDSRLTTEGAPAWEVRPRATGPDPPRPGVISPS